MARQIHDGMEFTSPDEGSSVRSDVWFGCSLSEKVWLPQKDASRL